MFAIHSSVYHIKQYNYERKAIRKIFAIHCVCHHFRRGLWELSEHGGPIGFRWFSGWRTEENRFERRQNNGLKSIISRIGEEFWRLRIGVGQPKSEENDGASEHEKLISHVLGEISPNEARILKQVIEQIPEIAKYWLSNEGNKAMNKYNSMVFEN